MKRAPLDRLADARQFASEVREIARGLDADDVDGSKHRHYAMRYCLLAIGEALSHVPAEYQAAGPAIPWRAIIGMRHRLAHDYWLIDSRIVLEVGKRHAGPLIEQLDRLAGDLRRAGV